MPTTCAGGTDAIRTGAPQWEIEALRRAKIPEYLRKRHGYAALSPANGHINNARLGGNNARWYQYRDEQWAEPEDDTLARSKAV